MFEPIIKHANLCLTVSSSDLTYFKKKYPNTHFVHVPCFHPNKKVNIKPGYGAYTLYHGNLSVSENINAAEVIINKLFKNIKTPLIIAGLNPPNRLIELIGNYGNISLIENPSDEELVELIQNAQINLLYTDQATGLKLKLLNVLYNGRHCILNSKMIVGTSLDKSCCIEDSFAELKRLIQEKTFQEFTHREIEERIFLLESNYTNENSIQTIVNSITILSTSLQL